METQLTLYSSEWQERHSRFWRSRPHDLPTLRAMRSCMAVTDDEAMNWLARGGSVEVMRARTLMGFEDVGEEEIQEWRMLIARAAVYYADVWGLDIHSATVIPGDNNKRVYVKYRWDYGEGVLAVTINRLGEFYERLYQDFVDYVCDLLAWATKF